MEYYLNHKQKEEIGYNYVMGLLNLTCVYGIEHLEKLKPFNDEAQLQHEFVCIEEVSNLVNAYPREFKEVEVLLTRFRNINSIIESLELMILDEVEIFEIKKFIYNINKLNDNFNKIKDKPDYLNFCDYTKLFEYLDQDNAKMPFFHLYDAYDSRLKSLREAIKNEEDKEAKGKLQIELSQVEVQVRRTISKEIASYQKDLLQSEKLLGYLDLLIAKANLVNKYELPRPSCDRNITLEQAYNPMVKDIVENNGYNYTMMDVYLQRDITLITGSNMSGKSVSLKNILLNTALFQYGFYPFAQVAKLPLLNYILYVSDELQDVQNSLSSFGMEVHILNEAIKIIDQVDNGLIILDEYARGTNPFEAKKIVTGLIKYLQKKDIFAILSTHLDLKLGIDFTHYQVKGLDDLQVDHLHSSDDILRVMDYSLVKVTNEKSIPHDAFKVMNLLKMNDELKKYIEEEYEKENESV